MPAHGCGTGCPVCTGTDQQSPKTHSNYETTIVTGRHRCHICKHCRHKDLGYDQPRRIPAATAGHACARRRESIFEASRFIARHHTGRIMEPGIKFRRAGHTVLVGRIGHRRTMDRPQPLQHEPHDSHRNTRARPICASRRLDMDNSRVRPAIAELKNHIGHDNGGYGAKNA